MATTVVHVLKAKFDVYCGRETSYNRCKHNQRCGGALLINPDLAEKGAKGYFGNPIALGQKCQVCGHTHEDTPKGRVALLKCYKRLFWNCVNEDVEFRQAVMALDGAEIGCWCEPKHCHLHVIRDWHKAGCPLKETA